MKVAAVQMTSTADRDANLATAQRLVRCAAEAGAELVVLPEMFNCLGTGAELRSGAEPIDGVTSLWARRLAADNAIVLVAGSFVESGTLKTLHSNTSCVFTPEGELVAQYRKVHLFDVDLPDAKFRESDTVAAGDAIVDVVVKARSVSVHLGLSICYDLRFPELFRILALREASLVTLPAAFTATTGSAHWEVLVRARAIEDQVFVIAAAQCGSSNGRLRWHGHSMIVDPWGTVLACAPGDGQSEAVVVADLDFEQQARIRSELPSLSNRQPSAYRWPPRSE